MKVLLSPDRDNNQYLENLYGIISKIGDVNVYKASSINFGLLKSGLNHFDFTFVSWLENSLVDKNSKKINLKTIFKFLLKIIILKFISKKIIYIRHNIYPHALKGKDAKIAKKLIDLVCKVSDKCVVHSGHLGEPYTYLPHPLYKFPFQAGDKKAPGYVIFGRIIEYKGIDKLLEQWKDMPLTIAGSVGSNSYLEKLVQLKKDLGLSSVQIDARFLSEAEARDIVESSRGLILSHNEDDMIVSGSFFFAASLGVPVYAIKSDFLTWLKNEHNFPFLTLFDSVENLVSALENIGETPETQKEEILNISNNLFGDDVIKVNLEKILL